MRSAQRGMERRMLGITWRDRIQTKVEDIVVTIKKKWTWAGHVMRRRAKRLTTKVTQWQPSNFFFFFFFFVYIIKETTSGL